MRLAEVAGGGAFAAGGSPAWAGAEADAGIPRVEAAPAVVVGQRLFAQ